MDNSIKMLVKASVITITWMIVTMIVVWQFGETTSLSSLFVLLPIPICMHLVLAKAKGGQGYHLFGEPWKVTAILLFFSISGGLQIFWGLTARGSAFEGAAPFLIGDGIFLLSSGILSCVLWFKFLKKLPYTTPVHGLKTVPAPKAPITWIKGPVSRKLPPS